MRKLVRRYLQEGRPPFERAAGEAGVCITVCAFGADRVAYHGYMPFR